MSYSLRISLPGIRNRTVMFGLVELPVGPVGHTLHMRFTQQRGPVAAFMKHVEAGFYEGTVFHRVIPGFMIQGGGYTAGLDKKATLGEIRNEADNGLRNDTGTVAMARTNDPHSATAQFFINTQDNDFLNHKGKTPDGWGYCVFGKVVEGMDVVNEIKGVKIGNAGFHQNVPVEPITITEVTVID